MVDNLIHLARERWLPSTADSRDFWWRWSGAARPPSVDLRTYDSLIEDQQQLGSCTGNALTNAYENMVRRQFPQQFVELSRLFVYYNARLISGDPVSVDSGASIRDGLRGLQRWGVCSESLWPYTISKFNTQPSQECYDDALPRAIPTYTRIEDIDGVFDALSWGYPVVVGMLIFSSFITLDTNNAVASDSGEPFDGHAVCIVGYDDSQQRFIAKNSYGLNWGVRGYFYIPYTYLTTYAFEQWIFQIPQQ